METMSDLNEDIYSEAVMPDGQTVENLLAKEPKNAAESTELASIRDSAKNDYDLKDIPNSAHAEREAQDDDLDIVFPKDNELQIDLDSDHAFDIFLEMLPLVERYFAIVDTKIMYSRSGAPKRHITVTLDQPVKNNFHRIALQLALGSDRVREFLSVVQENYQDPHPTLFLEKKV
jgi:hypothetical protein